MSNHHLPTERMEVELDIEAGLLACMVLSPDKIPLIRSIILSPEYFAFPEHKLIFIAACDSWEEHGDEDSLLVQTKNTLITQGNLERVGGVDYLRRIAESIASSASWEYYAKSLKEQHVKRRIALCGSEMLSIAKSEDPADVLIQQAQQKISDIAREEIAISDVVSMENFANIREKFSAEEYIKTGIESVDSVVRGFLPAETAIVAARTAMGKTVLAMDFAINMAKADHPVMVFSLEMSATELHKRLACNQSRIPADSYINNLATPEQERRAEIQREELSKLPLYIDENKRLTPEVFRSRVMQYKAKYNIQVAVVDFLTRVKGDRHYSGLYEKYTEIVDELTTIAKEEKIVLILVCQVNRGPEQRADKHPTMADLRDSGAIEQSADHILLIYRDDYYAHTDTGEAEIIIAKARHCSPRRVMVRFCPEYTRFEDL